MNKPKYVKINNELYEINTDFRQAIECERILRDKSIDDFEKMWAVIYTLFGERGLDCKEGVKLLEKRIRVYNYGYG